jgi:putative oxidoreductase
MKSVTADDVGKLVLRLALGVLVLLHGIGKLMGDISFIGRMLQGIGLPEYLSYGVYVGEVLAPLLLIVGWYSRVGALLVAVNMVFAIALAHQSELFRLERSGGWALELQGLFLFTAVALVLTGPGRIAINRR